MLEYEEKKTLTVERHLLLWYSFVILLKPLNQLVIVFVSLLHRLVWCPYQHFDEKQLLMLLILQAKVLSIRNQLKSLDSTKTSFLPLLQTLPRLAWNAKNQLIIFKKWFEHRSTWINQMGNILFGYYSSMNDQSNTLKNYARWMMNMKFTSLENWIRGI